MGRYSGSTTQQESSVRKPKQPHGIWRGIGCLMMVIIPAISILIGIQIVNTALENKWRMPSQLLGYPQLADVIYKIGGLRDLLVPLTKVQHLYAYIVVSLICMALISSVISMIYAVIYRIVNPVRYGPLDAPPSGRKAKKHSR
jgi:uncharacterized SAM-binding protein YcdF (DUF218 family)